ncbi:MAG: energy-coupled thiamine transporter ThiT [Synergistaceae bacterium]|nr:energy-coupled thiamine transporter ThiT [Synergistaceae bacterium]
MSNSPRISIIAEGALCAALSVVLNYLTIFRMPQGGSINLELVPLFVFAYRYGWKWGVEVGILVGFLHMMFGGYVVHPVQALLEYPLACGVLGFAGIWRKNMITLITGTVLTGIVRYSFHVIAGVVFFSEFAKGENVLVYSLIYNSFVFPQLVINTIVALLLFRTLEKIQGLGIRD